MLTMIRSLGFICLLVAVSTMAQTPPPVLDSEGQPLRRGVRYYVDPAVADVAGSLTLLTRNGSCPSYVGRVTITRGKTFTGPRNLTGIPVIFTPTNPQDTIVTESTDLSVAISASLTCNQVPKNTTWGIGEDVDPETRRRLVTIGGEAAFFRINSDEAPGPYTFGWCPTVRPICRRCPSRCGVAGILEQNGTRFLALDGPAFPFRFRRV